MHSPIQLLSRKFLNIELHPQAQNEEAWNFGLSHMIFVERDEDDPTLWRATVGVRLKDKEEKQPAPYIGEIRCAGHFRLDPEFPENKAEDMVHLNAGAILYGAIREFVLTHTSQSVHGELVLPTLDARCFLPKTKDENNNPE
ncbi:protein-export chaperone SecB [Verrucomicrobiaceae bacterium R5-34]|nr:protein-export chaperone SecB [Verrucomicrobiaceae bacterium R5-34]